MTKSDILFNAILSLKKVTGLPIELVAAPSENIDSNILIGSSKDGFITPIKRDIHESNLPKILHQLASFDSAVLLVAQNISKRIKSVLKEKDINYLDIAGNCFIKNKEDLFIFVDGLKPISTLPKSKHQAFNKNGIKLIFAFLLDSTLINQSYSVMAEVANISKSTIGSILEDLVTKGFLIQKNKKQRQLINKEALFEHWVRAFNEKLKPSLFRGQYMSLDKDFAQNWTKIDLEPTAFWGGEPAAYLLTRYLRPEQWILYSDENKGSLIQQLKFVPAPNSGQINVYSPFWSPNNDLQLNTPNLAAVIIAYADLVQTSDARNFETANRIYEEFLSSYLAQ